MAARTGPCLSGVPDRPKHTSPQCLGKRSGQRARAASSNQAWRVGVCSADLRRTGRRDGSEPQAASRSRRQTTVPNSSTGGLGGGLGAALGLLVLTQRPCETGASRPASFYFFSIPSPQDKPLLRPQLLAVSHPRLGSGSVVGWEATHRRRRTPFPSPSPHTTIAPRTHPLPPLTA